MNFNYLNPYYLSLEIKNFLHKENFLKQDSYKIPVISIGNLSMGGTGKTPFVLYLIDLIFTFFNEKFKRSAHILVISKSYKASLAKPQEVTDESAIQPEVFGDEPCLIKSLKKNVSVWSGPQKSITLKKAIEHYKTFNKPVDIIIIDDGFSHLKIKRNMDLVLIDTSQKKSHYRLLPFGFLRESFKSLKRADLVALTKINYKNNETYEFILQQINQINLDKSEKLTCIESSYEMMIPKNLEKSIILFSGIAHPEPILNFLKGHGFHIKHFFRFSDHFSYPLDVQNEIFLKFSNQKNVSLLTTAKDYIKINYLPLREKTQILELKLIIDSAAERRLIEKVSQIF